LRNWDWSADVEDEEMRVDEVVRVEEGMRVVEGVRLKSGGVPSVPSVPEGYAKKPVTFVGLAEARAYCAHHGKRLPASYEWQVYRWPFDMTVERTVWLSAR
jgi:formylglycine-generating enzyme required for sulfatase activity